MARAGDPFKITNLILPKYESLYFGKVLPSGWLKEQIKQNLAGFTGHLDSLVPALILEDDIYGRDRHYTPDQYIVYQYLSDGKISRREDGSITMEVFNPVTSARESVRLVPMGETRLRQTTFESNQEQKNLK